MMKYKGFTSPDSDNIYRVFWPRKIKGFPKITRKNRFKKKKTLENETENITGNHKTKNEFKIDRQVKGFLTSWAHSKTYCGFLHSGGHEIIGIT